MTMYGSDTNFVANDAMRYSVGDRTVGLVKGKDNSITIYIQPESTAEASSEPIGCPRPNKANSTWCCVPTARRNRSSTRSGEPPALVAVPGWKSLLALRWSYAASAFWL